MSLTQEQVLTAWKLRARNVGWNRIGAELGCSGRTVRDTLFPEYGQAMLERRKRARRVRRKAMPVDPRIKAEPIYTLPIPHDVLAERDHRASIAPRSLTAAVFGDPLPGFSALDRRREA